MRDIRFRAWIIKTKQMVYGVEQDNDLADIITDNKYEKGNYELMQFTGLYDKNKVPIYEGDILEIKEENYKYIVKFYEGCFVCVNKYDEHFEQAKLLKDIFTLDMQVIGNIYDNPDLLGE